MTFRQLLTVTAVTAAMTASADLLVFKSGSRLVGKIDRIEGGEIKFTSDDVGSISVKQDKVASFTTEANSKILYTDKTTEEAVVSMTNGQYEASGKSLDMAKVKAVNPEPEAWHGSVNLSASAARGNTVSENVSLIADVKRRWEKDRFTADGGYYFAQSGKGRENKEKTEDRIDLGMQEDHFWVGKLYSYINGRYERDGINDLQYRYRIGVGLGYQWLDGTVFESTGKWSFSQEVGGTYIKEKYEHIKDDDRLAFRYAHHLEWVPRWADKLAFTHNFEYLPDVDDWSETYLIDTDAGFTFALIGAWQLIGRVEWDYNSNPGPSTKSSDFRYLLGLGYKW